MSLDSVLARQAGVISRRQALAAGLGADAIDHRLRLRRWRPLHPGVYLVAGHRLDGEVLDGEVLDGEVLDSEVTVRAALLWAGNGAVLSGVAAAWWEGMAERAPATVGVTVGRHRRPRSRPGVSLRRRTLAAEDLVVHRGLAATARPLTVLEAAVELGGPGSLLLDRALQRWVRFPAVYEAYCRNLGAHGSASAGRMLVAAADRAASQAERLLVTMLRESGVTGWRCAFPVAGHALDIAFPAARVAIEVDGWAWHMDAERAAADVRRQHALVRAGWTILRYTWHDLVDRPEVVLAEVAREIGRARAATG